MGGGLSGMGCGLWVVYGVVYGWWSMGGRWVIVAFGWWWSMGSGWSMGGGLWWSTMVYGSLMVYGLAYGGL